MKKTTSKSLTREQLAELEAIATMPDSAIDTSDAPEVLDWTGAKRGAFYRPIKQQLTLRLDADVVAWFKTHITSGKGYQTRINQALRQYIRRQEKGNPSSTRSDSSPRASENLPAHDTVPGFEASASDCIKRARQIARSLTHKWVSYDHLMLALTMDQSARRLLEPVGDIAQLRTVAMRKLAKNYNRSEAGDQSPTPTSDFADIDKRAREAAAERNRTVALSDLIDALPKARGRLTYGSDDQSQVMAWKFSPRVDFTTFVETVHAVMQGKVVDDLSNQIRQFLDVQFAVAREDLDEKLLVTLIELGSDDQVTFAGEARFREPQPSARPTRRAD